MANAKKDSNSVSSLIAVSSSNGTGIILVKANPTGHGLKVVDAHTGSDFGPNHALKDENDISTLLALSSSDGVSPVAVYADSSGNLLIDSL